MPDDVSTTPTLPLAEALRIAARAGPIDGVELERRATELAGRAIGSSARAWALDLAIRCTDLTSLEGSDTPERIAELCATARHPDPDDPQVPPVAAVCVYPQLVPTALEHLRGTPVRVASVAGGFPAGLTPLEARLTEIRAVVAMGVDEIDVVLNRSLVLQGRDAEAFEELVAARKAAGDRRLKVIVEVGELGAYERIRRASMLAIAAGADFVKTSTGKVAVGATPPAALCVMEAVRDAAEAAGLEVGVKVAGGVRTAEQAIGYLVLAQETLGPRWLGPQRFRFGASSLLADLVRRLAEGRTGLYRRPEPVRLA
jgi:deoxyribose-phosphate aldolase